MGGAALLITAICWLPLMRNVTHSIAAMKKATARIAEGHFDVESRESRRDELGLLDRSINQMADRLQTLTEGRKRFLGDAAHELRSPIARMQLAAEILERHSAPGTEKYVASLKEDLTMMTQLTDELLAFARAEGTFQPAQLTPVNVADAASPLRHPAKTRTSKFALSIPARAFRKKNSIKSSRRFIGWTTLEIDGPAAPVSVSLSSGRVSEPAAALWNAVTGALPAYRSSFG